jgi:P-type conjugative transfer protein TrbJ
MKNVLYLSLIFIFIPSALKAQDVATEHTQVLNNIELITENLRQLQSLYNQVEMIKNQVEGLKSVATFQNSFGDMDTLREALTNVISEGMMLSDRTQSLLNSMQQQAGKMTVDGTMIDEEMTLGQGTMNIVQNALDRVKEQRESYQREMDGVNSLMAKNNQSVGQTQALQTLNELTAQIIPQMQLTRELLSEQISMQAAMMGKENQEKQDMANKMGQIIHPIDNSESSFDLGRESS